MMKWADFVRIAEEQGIEDNAEIDAIDMIRERFDISHTDEDGYKGVIEVKEKAE